MSNACYSTLAYIMDINHCTCIRITNSSCHSFLFCSVYFESLCHHFSGDLSVSFYENKMCLFYNNHGFIKRKKKNKGYFYKIIYRRTDHRLPLMRIYTNVCVCVCDRSCTIPKQDRLLHMLHTNTSL